MAAATRVAILPSPTTAHPRLTGSASASPTRLLGPIEARAGTVLRGNQDSRRDPLERHHDLTACLRLCPVEIAALHRVEPSLMSGDHHLELVAPEALVGSEEESPDPAAEIGGELEQCLAGRNPPKRLVELVVEVEERVGVPVSYGHSHLVDDALNLDLRLRTPVLDCRLDHQLLEGDAYSRDVAQGRVRHGDHMGSAARSTLDQPLLRQLGERLADGDGAHTELRSDSPLDEMLPGMVSLLRNRVAKG